MFAWALLACIATSALVLSGCSTIGSRIDSHRAAFDQLSAQDQALVNEGRIRGGMSQEAVYIAWGQPQQKAVGIVHNATTETWVYTLSTAAYGPYGYGYGYGHYGYGFAGPVGFYGRHGRFRYYGSFSYPYLGSILLSVSCDGELSGENGLFSKWQGRRLSIPDAEQLLTLQTLRSAKRGKTG